MAEKQIETWDLWYPKAGATGISFARSRIEPAESVLVHAAPEVLTVTIWDGNGSIKAAGKDLRMNADTPITWLYCEDGSIRRQDIWPEEEQLGMVVILPGGEAGMLRAWWHAPDYSEWRWQVEFYNHR